MIPKGPIHISFTAAELVVMQQNFEAHNSIPHAAVDLEAVFKLCICHGCTVFRRLMNTSTIIERIHARQAALNALMQIDEELIRRMMRPGRKGE